MKTGIPNTGYQILNIGNDRLTELESLFEYYLECETTQKTKTAPEVSKAFHLGGEIDLPCPKAGKTPRGLMQVETVEQPLQSTVMESEAKRTGLQEKKGSDPLGKSALQRMFSSDAVGTGSDPKRENYQVQPRRNGAGPTLTTIHHKLPNYIGSALALAILPLLFFGLGRETSSKKDSANAYFQAKEQILGLAASPEPKSSAKDYLLEAREAFKRAQEISQEKELSQEDKNKVTNLINLALQTLSDGVAKYPNEAALYFERATIYKALIQSSPEAKEKMRLDLEKALELAPNAPNVLALYGRFLVEEGEIEKAKAIFNQLLQLLPKNSQDYQIVVGWRAQLEPTPTPTPSPTATLTPIPTETPTPTPQQDTSEESVPTTSEVELSPTPEENTSEVKSSDTSEVEL